ncbi:MAG: flagellar hook-basal body complex protein FliE [Proteobacteria bacterium]|nr:flagellar hook-basal body complex protein FliE [Pseudomonadota bacterium]MBU1714595.1 flagellar hook-basal body complex protein FliE [Pseudomonadota bacterium]
MINNISNIAAPGKSAVNGVTGKTETAGGFGEALRGAIDAVNNNLNEAETATTGLVSGQHANIHETMIAMEKANVSFRLLTKFQAKAIAAYQEIMRMQL